MKYILQPKIKSHLILTKFDTTRNAGGIPAKIGQHVAKFSESRQIVAKIRQKLANISALLTKILRLENGVKECIV